MSQDGSKVEFLQTEQLDTSAYIDQIYCSSVLTNISMPLTERVWSGYKNLTPPYFVIYSGCFVSFIHTNSMFIITTSSRHVSLVRISGLNLDKHSVKVETVRYTMPYVQCDSINTRLSLRLYIRLFWQWCPDLKIKNISILVFWSICNFSLLYIHGQRVKVHKLTNERPSNNVI